MAHDELDQVLFRQVPGGYDTEQVDDLLDRLRAAADDGRPLGPLVDDAGLDLRGRGYDPAAVDGLLDRLAGRAPVAGPVDGTAGPDDLADLGGADRPERTDGLGRARRLWHSTVLLAAVAAGIWLWIVHTEILEAVAERWGGTAEDGRTAAIWAAAMPGLLGVGRAVVIAAVGGRRFPRALHLAGRALATVAGLVLFAVIVVAAATFVSPLPGDGSQPSESVRAPYVDRYENPEIGQGVFDATGAVALVGGLALAAAAGASFVAGTVAGRRAERWARSARAASGPIS